MEVSRNAGGLQDGFWNSIAALAAAAKEGVSPMSTENGQMCVSYEWAWCWCDKCEPELLSDILNTEYFLSARAEWRDNVKWETRNQDTSTLFNISRFPRRILHIWWSEYGSALASTAIVSGDVDTRHRDLGPLCPLLLAAVTCHVSHFVTPIARCVEDEFSNQCGLWTLDD